MKRVAIVGSCVSRDAFSMFPDEGLQVVYYCQQTCVPSVMSKAILAPADINDYPLSVFFRRNLLRDLNKTLFLELEKYGWLLHEAPVALNVVWGYAALRISTRWGAGVVRTPMPSRVSKAAWRVRRRLKRNTNSSR
jgi:hypothetical protein